MFTPYSFQGGTAMLDPHVAGTNGQSRIPEFMGTAYPQNYAAGVPMTNVGVNPAVAPAYYGAYPTTGIHTAIPTTVGVTPNYGYPTVFPTAPGFIPTQFGQIPTPYGAIPHPAFNAFGAVNPFAATAIPPTVFGLPTIPSIYNPAFNPMSHLTGINPFATTPFGMPVTSPFGIPNVSPFGIATQPFVPSTIPQTPFARNIFGTPTINPFVNPIFGTAPFSTPFVDPTIALACQAALCGTVNPTINPIINSLAATPFVNHPAYNPVTPFGIAPTINPITGTPTCLPWNANSFFPNPVTPFANPLINRFHGSTAAWQHASSLCNPITSSFNNPLATIGCNPLASMIQNPWLTSMMGNLASCCGVNPTLCNPALFGGTIGNGLIPTNSYFSNPITQGCWPSCGI